MRRSGCSGAMTHTRQLPRRLIWALLAGALLISIKTPGCRYWAGPLPLGTDNNVRVANTLAASEWAQPMELPGLSNLHKVSDDLYRGAEPTAEGVQQLKKLGLKTIIDLRSAGAPKDLRANSHDGLAAGR